MKYAYVTIATNDSYIPCIIKNAQRMRYLGCKYPFVILLSESLRTNEYIPLLIKESNIKIQFFNDINYSNIYHQIDKDQLYFDNKKVYSSMYNTLNKFEILTLTNYDFLIFLDGDVIISKNIDFLFNKYYKYNQYFILEKTKILNSLNNENCFTYYFPNGQIFLCKPNLSLYKKLKKEFFKKEFDDDEILFTKLFFNNILLSEPFSRNFYIHFDGRFKAFNANLPICNYFFEQTTAHEFNILYNKYINDIEVINTKFDELDILSHNIGAELKLGGV